MRIKVIFIAVTAFMLSSCAPAPVTCKVSDVYGDEHFQHVTIEFFQGSNALPVSGTEIDFLDANSSGGGYSGGSQCLSITSKSIKGFARPEIIDLKLSNIKTKDEEDVSYAVPEQIAVASVEKCQPYVVAEPLPSDGAYVLNSIHVSPYSIVIGGSGKLKKPVHIEVRNRSGEAFDTWKSTSEWQQEDSFMIALSFFRKIDDTNITTISIEGTPYKVVPIESELHE